MKISMGGLAFTVILLLLSTLSGCETKEENDIAQAQQCLDKLSDSAPYTSAQACLNYISGIYSPPAYVIRCSVDFISGGITPTSLITAFQNMKSASSSQQTAILMGALTQYTPGAAISNANISLTQAQTTFADCQASDTPSLIFIAGVSVTGTALAAGAGSATSTTFITTCQTTPSSCNPAVIGSAAQSLASTYCTGSNASSTVCTSINNAIAAGGSDPTAIGTALIASLH